MTSDDLLKDPGYSQAQIPAVPDESLAGLQKIKATSIVASIAFWKADSEKARFAHFSPNFFGK